MRRGAMPPPKDVVKIAIQMVGAIPQLIELQQSKPLAAVLKDVCDAWSLPNAERYALQYADGRQTYITESNRGEIKNGSILRLTTSPVHLLSPSANAGAGVSPLLPAVGRCGPPRPQLCLAQ